MHEYMHECELSLQWVNELVSVRKRVRKNQWQMYQMSQRLNYEEWPLFLSYGISVELK